MALLRDLPLQGLSPYLIQHRDNPVDWRPSRLERWAL